MKNLDIFKEKLDINALEEAMKQTEGAISGSAMDDNTMHDFADGVYVRTLFIPAGYFIIGKRHRFETCNILLQGEISIYQGEGEPVIHLKAPCIFNSKPGVKKLGYAHTDVLFSNVHPTDETDLEKIEKKFIISEQEYMECKEKLCLGEQ